MFQFRRFPTYDYFIHHRLTVLLTAGFPHSEIHGSKPAFGYPWLIADRCVLRRLLVPRHSPCALCSLTIFLLVLLWVLSSTIIFVVFYPNKYYLSLCFVQFSRCNVFSMNLGFSSDRRVERYTSEEKFSNSRKLVGSSGLEPPTSRLSGVRSNHLSYEPV